MQNMKQLAQKAAERKLQWIIDRYGDADGERRKPYYLEQLTQEAQTAICFKVFGLALMELDNEKAPTPTKVSEA